MFDGIFVFVVVACCSLLACLLVVVVVVVVAVVVVVTSDEGGVVFIIVVEKSINRFYYLCLVDMIGILYISCILTLSTISDCFFVADNTTRSCTSLRAWNI